jgi:hypothetical protein
MFKSGIDDDSNGKEWSDLGYVDGQKIPCICWTAAL